MSIPREVGLFSLEAIRTKIVHHEGALRIWSISKQFIDIVVENDTYCSERHRQYMTWSQAEPPSINSSKFTGQYSL